MTPRRWRVLAALDKRGSLPPAEVALMVSPRFGGMTPTERSVLGLRTAEMWAHAYVAPLVAVGYVVIANGRIGITPKGRQAWQAEHSMPLFPDLEPMEKTP